MLHADGTYHSNPLFGLIRTDQPRGAGVELQALPGRPGCGGQRAPKEPGYIVLNPPADKPHGMREAYILDPDGYCWVVSMPLAKKD